MEMRGGDIFRCCRLACPRHLGFQSHMCGCKHEAQGYPGQPMRELEQSSSAEQGKMTNGSYSHMDEVDEGELYGHEEFTSSPQHSYLQEWGNSHISSQAQPQTPSQSQSQNQSLNQSQRQFQHVKASKSMDLVADESNVGSLVGTTA
ncbi:unnamed protein product, partial [Pleuronectes platessa]